MLSSSSSVSEAGSRVKPSAVSGRALVGGIEAAHALDLVAEEIEPQRLLLARREQVDQRPAHRKFASIGDGVGAQVADGIAAVRPSALAPDPLALGRCDGELADAERRQRALRCGVGRRDEQLRPVALGLQRAEASPAAPP